VCAQTAAAAGRALREAKAKGTRLKGELDAKPVTPKQWFEFGETAVEPAVNYFKVRFMDFHVVATGHGRKAINKGLQATKGYLAASIFDVPYLVALSKEGDDLEQVQNHLEGLLNFDFVSKDDVAAAIREAPAVMKHALAHSRLPEVCVKDEIIMQKGSLVKKAAATIKIKQRRLY